MYLACVPHSICTCSILEIPQAAALIHSNVTLSRCHSAADLFLKAVEDALYLPLLRHPEHSFSGGHQKTG